MAVTAPTRVNVDDVVVHTLAGRPTTLAPYAGQVRLFVNFSTRCVPTPQYAKLEALQRRFGHRGFTVLGFPSNQFFEEPGDERSIFAFCALTHPVKFPMFAKIKVNGRTQHPLYSELTRAPDATGRAGRVRWNYEKFLVTPAGGAHRFHPRTPPDAPEIISLIEASLPVST
ncbi:glutathione peroxidase [Pengzhenrongella sicca]|uniref:glutathione peroxidase n=1 Tax=Pengzhenrongella sicca TaxID=2819238 RepID=UPI001D0C4CEF|nr:glutathione peroxidase [Pengzhenrongella sicca]